MELETKFIRPKELAEMLCVSYSTVFRYVHSKRDEGFPQPIRFSHSVTLFDREAVKAYFERVVEKSKKRS